MNIPKKAKDSLIVILPMVLILAIVSIVYAHGINAKASAIRANWMPSAIHLNQINTLTSDLRIVELQHILSTSEEQMLSYEAQRNQKISEIEHEMASYETLITTQLERELYATFLDKWRSYQAESRTVLAFSRQNRNEEAKALIRDRSQVLFDDYSNVLLQLVKENKSWAERESDEADRLFVFSFITVLLMSMMLGLLVYRTLKAIIRRYNEIVAMTAGSVNRNYVI